MESPQISTSSSVLPSLPTKVAPTRRWRNIVFGSQTINLDDYEEMNVLEAVEALTAALEIALDEAQNLGRQSDSIKFG